jgi:hypothetical protein
MATFGTFVGGQVLTAAELNSAGAWQDYTPTWTQSATITKTVNWARFTQLNKLVQGSIKMTASSAGTANNKILVGLPVGASTNNFIIGQMTFMDDSSNTDVQTTIAAYFESSTTVSFAPFFQPTSDPALALSPSTGAQTLTTRLGQNFTAGNGGSITGLTVASGDIIYIQFAYEAA